MRTIILTASALAAAFAIVTAAAAEKGIFGAYMALELVNDGPVTIVFET